jgi:hypothetical protein
MGYMTYSSNQIEAMREALAEYWINEMPEDSMKELLMNGCTGYAKIPEDELVEEFEEVFGEEYFDGD